MKKRKGSYAAMFLKRNELKTRQCVYVSQDIHTIIARLVRRLVDNGNDVTVGGYIDNVLNEHLREHRQEINEIYRQERDNLL